MPAFNHNTKPKAFKSRSTSLRECNQCGRRIDSRVIAYRLEHSWMYIFDTEICAQEYLKFMLLKKSKQVAKARKDSACYKCNIIINRGTWYYHPYGNSTWGTRTKKFCSPECYETFVKLV